MASQRQQSLDAFAQRQGYRSYYDYRNAKATAKGFSSYREQRRLRQSVANMVGVTKAGAKAAEVRDRVALAAKEAAEATGTNVREHIGSLESFAELLKTGNTGLTQEELLHKASDMLGMDATDNEREIWEWIRGYYPRRK